MSGNSFGERFRITTFGESHGPALGAIVDGCPPGDRMYGSNRLCSGCGLRGPDVRGPLAWLSRSPNQLTALKEGHERELLGYISPGTNRFSVMNIYLSKLMPGKRFNFTTTTNGSERAMVPVGAYEEVMPLDILPTQLLRALVVGDTDSATALGALELLEEDLSLCTFVCPGRSEYGPITREHLTTV